MENTKEPTPIEKLDAVLNFLNSDHEHQHKVIGVQKGLSITLDEATVHKILMQLEKDDNVLMREVKIDPPISMGDNFFKSSEYMYIITFKGQLFKSKGGYAQQEKDIQNHRENLEIDVRLKKRNEYLVAYGSLAAAIIAGFLLLVELWKVFHTECCCCH